jgi:hypothetical protein
MAAKLVTSKSAHGALALRARVRRFWSHPRGLLRGWVDSYPMVTDVSCFGLVDDGWWYFEEVRSAGQRCVAAKFRCLTPSLAKSASPREAEKRDGAILA